MMAHADPPLRSRLTSAERVVLACIMDGLSDNEIADRLGLSINTVKVHKGNIRCKWGGTEAGQGWWITVARTYEPEP